MHRIIRQAMNQPDDLAIQLDYTASDGSVSRRVVSPIRFLAGDQFLALCLCREEPRQFHLNRCSNARIVRASDILMPVPMINLAPVPDAAEQFCPVSAYIPR